MKKIVISFLLSAFYFLLSTTSAQTIDNQLIDADTADVEKSLQFKQFSSCKDMDKVLDDYVDIFKDSSNDYYGGRWWGVMEDASNKWESDAVPTQSASEPGVASSTTDYSKTNVQKAWVEEPEIIKTNWKYIYYYNQEGQKIYIVNSPLNPNTSIINLKNAKVVTVINIPDGFYNVQLFVTKTRLIILWTKYSNVNYYDTLLSRYQSTALAIYDTMSITSPKLLKYVSMDWYYTDARMIGNKLYVISQLGINRYYYTPYTTKYTELMPKVAEKVNGKRKEYLADCNQISYVLPSKDTFKKYNISPSFTIVSVVDALDTSKPTKMNVTMTQAWQIHMSKNSLYLLQNLYFYNPRPCPRGAMCLMANYSAGEQTLIHKFGIDGYALKYQKSALVPGTLLMQYSMDEDTYWNFRILTQKLDFEPGTNFYALNSNLKLKWKIEKIAPGEQFKASRYIGDKLYLVTFQQIDPLFVIDITNLSKPKIVGELKVPGYSTYLHPLKSAANWIQYLVWLGYGVGTGSRWWTTNSWIKLSLYEVNYNLKDTTNSDYIKISELSSMSLGWEWSRSEALENPRLFVMDKKNNVTLPMLLQTKSKNGENCSIQYDEAWAEVSRYCYPIDKWNLNFAGLKSFSFDTVNGIKEVFSKNYSDVFAKVKNSTEVSFWDLYNAAMRVWYAGDSLYMFSIYFADFLLPSLNQSQTIYFSNILKK